MLVSTIKQNYTKSEIEKLVSIKDQSLSFVKSSCAKSSCWDKYCEILISDIRQGFVLCNECRSLLTLTPPNGTNIMKKHSLRCSKAKESSSLHPDPLFILSSIL